MGDENLIRLQHFFEVDVRIKREMHKMAPPNDYLDNDSIVKYLDRLYDSLDYVFNELKCVALDMFGKESFQIEKITVLEQESKKAFYACGTDINRLRQTYENYISNMDKGFLDQVKDECIGYTFRFGSAWRSATTVNEMLHYMHSFVVNNDHILQAIPAIDEKINNNNEPITLRGYPSEEFKNLYDQIPTDLDIGITDMVCLNDNKMTMMIRDRGHALTIEVTKENGGYFVEYFVPKICNVEMVNSLPGVTKVKDDKLGTRGVFGTNIDNLSDELISFIAAVPTDENMLDFEPEMVENKYA